MRKCSDNIYMLIRGQIYNFEEKKCLAIGGADSVDKLRRTEGLNWWKAEQITKNDVAAAIDNGKNIDYVFSHAAPAAVLKEYSIYLCNLNLDEDYIDHTSENRLQKIMENINFSHWFFAHYHIDLQLNDAFTCCYNSFKEII